MDVGQFGGVDEVPSACFGAVFIRKSAFEAVGPLDRGYGSFYEDVDWSFRCWFGGLRIVAAPDAVVYHKFGGSYLSRPKLRFVVRNRQRLVLKLFRGKVRLGVSEALSEGGRQERPVAGRNAGNGSMAGAYAAAYVSLVAPASRDLAQEAGGDEAEEEGRPRARRLPAEFPLLLLPDSERQPEDRLEHPARILPLDKAGLTACPPPLESPPMTPPGGD